MGEHSEILEQVIGVSDRAVVLHGPAGSGKTTVALALYRRFVSDIGRARCLLVLPNGAAVSAARQSLLAASGGTLLAPQVTTFASLAQRILSASAVAARMISPMSRHLLLRSIVDELHASKKLRALGSVADTPGLIATLDLSIAELKRAAAEPDDLAAAIGATDAKAQGKVADLLEIYRRYQQHLQAHGLYDVEGQMWQAREELAKLAAGRLPAGMEELTALAVDGFTDFTPTQLRMLAMLQRLLKPVLITLPLGGDGRKRLWQWTGQTLERIRAAFAGKIQTITLPPSSTSQHRVADILSACAEGVSPSSSHLLAVSSSERPQEQFTYARNTETAKEGTARISKDAGETPTTHEGRMPSSHAGDLASIRDTVFDMDAAPEPAPRNLRIIAAAGIEAEVAAVARRIKRLLVQGAPPGSIALLARSMEPYRPAVERIFADHDIPIVSAATSLVDSPLVRFLLKAAGVAPEFNFRDVLAVIKSSYFRPQALGEFDARTAAAAETLIRQGNVLQGRQSYIHAADRLILRAQRQAQRDAESDDSPKPKPKSPLPPEAVKQALAMLTKLFDAAEAAQAGDLTGLATQLQLDQAATWQNHSAASPLWRAGSIARDLRSLAAMEQAMAQVRNLGLARGDGSAWQPPVTQLAQALAATTVPAERGENLVDVMDVLDARALRYEHVFLLGAGEGVFPRKFVESSLVGEADRQAWRRGNIELDRRGDLTAREMLLFYLAVSQASASLTISYLASDASGKVASPSSFLLSLIERFGGLQAMDDSGLIEHVTAGQFLPPPQEIATPRDAFNFAFADLFRPDRLKTSGGNPNDADKQARQPNLENDGGQAGSKVGLPVGAVEPSTKEIAVNQTSVSAPPSRFFWASRGLLARHHRWQRGPCDSFDGRLSDPDLLAELAQVFPAKTVFSASQFSCYGQCPWQFFATYVLQLQPLQEPQRVLEAIDAGEFCHDVLFRLMTSLSDGVAPLRLSDVDEPRLVASLDRAVQAESDRIESHRPPYPVLWKIQRTQMRKALLAYLRYQRALPPLEGGATHFELSFGLPLTDEQLKDGHSRAAPVRLKTPGCEFQLHGRIDRVDQAAFQCDTGILSACGEGVSPSCGVGILPTSSSFPAVSSMTQQQDAGKMPATREARMASPHAGETPASHSGLLVVDYKTGRLPSEADIDEGRNLQLPLYAAAAEQILGRPALGGVFHHVGENPRMRFFAAFKFAHKKYSACEDYPQRQAAAMAKAQEFINGMSGGRFDLLPKKKCPTWCPYRRICHFSPARLPLKSPPPVDSARAGEPQTEGQA